MIITLIISCIVIISLHYCFVHYRRNGRLFDNIPGKQPLPIFGDILDLSHRSPVELWKMLHERLNTYYPVTRIWSFSTAYVGTKHPDDMEVILNNTKHIEKAFMYKFFRSWLKTGLLTSTGSKWHQRRKILTPAFHFHILKQFFDILVEEGNEMTESLKNIEGRTIENLLFFISHHTLNIICETAMGTSLHDMSQHQQQYRDAIHQMGKIFTYRLMRPWFHFDFIFSFSSMYKIQTESLKILHGFTEKIIAERKRYHEQTGGRHLKNIENESVTEENDVEMIVKKKRLAMLDLLIAASHENNLSDLDIREEVDTFMFEGHDTVAIAICFTLLLLAEHKDIQDRVRSEVDVVMQKNAGKLTTTALNDLVYLERCVKESLRLYPSVPFIARNSAEDVKIQKHMVPFGTTIALDIIEAHRDPNFWPNPDVFDPDRFLPENIAKRHPYSYIPFSAGSRNCIGQRFAMMELKTIIAYLVHNCRLEPIDYLKDFQFQIDMLLRVTHPIRLKFIPIERMQSTEIKDDLLS